MRSPQDNPTPKGQRKVGVILLVIGIAASAAAAVISFLPG